MTLTEWCNTPTAVANAQALQQNTTYIDMMNVMREEMPLVRIPLAFGASATDYAYAHGMQKGFEYALKVWKAMGQTAPEMPQEPEATFSPINNI